MCSKVAAYPAKTRNETKYQEEDVRLKKLDDRGMATAEYAIVMLAAAAFAGLLMLVLRSDSVREMLTGIVQQALSL